MNFDLIAKNAKCIFLPAKMYKFKICHTFVIRITHKRNKNVVPLSHKTNKFNSL